MEASQNNHRRLRARGWTLVVALFALALTACGSSANETEEGPEPAAAATDTPTAGDDGTSPAADPAEEQEQVDLTIGLIAGPQALTTGLFSSVADELGYFEEENISFETVNFTSGGDVTNGLISGEIDMAHMGPEGLVASSQGADIIAIAANVDTSVFALMSRPDLDWDSLEGATFGTSGLSTIPTLIATQVLRDAGYEDPQEQLEFVVAGSTPQTFQALLAGQVDVIPSSAPFIFLGEDQGYRVLGYSAPGGEVPQLSATLLATTRTFADANEDAVLRYLRVMLRLRDYMHDPANREELVQIVAKITEQDQSIAERAMELYLDSETHADYYLPEGLRISDTGMQNVADAFVQLGTIEESELMPIEEFVDHSYLEEAETTLG